MTFEPTNSLLHRLHRASQIAADRLAKGLGKSSLTERQIVVLAAIEAHGGGSQTDLVKATGVDRSTTADIVKRLIKCKLVTRRRSKEDARAYVVTLTAEGRRVLAAAIPVMARVETDLLSRITASQRDAIFKALDAMLVVPDQD